ncbi:MAG: histidine kinase dimerization/phosphoacceptor domain -containing protein [Crocinitomicaceae bacterium]
MKFIDVIEELSKSTNLHEGKIELLTREILKKSSNVLSCERCNAWIFDKDDEQLESILSFSSISQKYSIELPLKKSELPGYFSFLKKNKLIVSIKAQEEPMNVELLVNYLIPNNIMSMIDVPLRAEGKMVGVICFEKVGKEHIWTEDEQKYTQSVGQLLSLALETKEKRVYREELEKIISQKEVLIAEINHRVKNNMAVILSLLNLQKAKVKDPFHELLFDEFKNKVYSMAVVQEQLHSKDNIDCIDLGEYIKQLTENLYSSHEKEIAVCLELELDIVELDVSRAIPCGLIVNEILTNCYKYAFNNKNLFPKLEVSLKKEDENVALRIKDNGMGFNRDKAKDGMGIDLIRGLAEQIDGAININTSNGVEVKLVFSI